MSNILPLMMGLMMFTMGLGLTREDFSRILAMPKAILAGTGCQLLLLPMIGLLVAKLFGLSDTLSIGLMILCVCPGGILSNYISFTARGDMALSITLTLISSIVCIFSIPLLINAYQAYLDMEQATIRLPILDTMRTIAVLTLLPISAGMFTRYRWPAFAESSVRWLSMACSAMLSAYILFLWYQQREGIIAAFEQVGGPVMAVAAMASIVAWLVSTGISLEIRQRITLIIETSIQNSALAFTVAVFIMEEPAYAIPTTFYTVAMFLPALLIIAVTRKLSAETLARSRLAS
ncbi:bile acid:sodium symporter family protein [Parahaliea sp. F7430]|uniref:Bile acid:sodium symporter family protein n=1 Tax=Sediminihaliea albiluteola TaxID=2758564 RepID=A0A7W2TTV4_9GAMM|nr:bile acid:sodium symporter [Sediminihaliea albiluteola]MBA6411827.1 bile acid:sodium symporter family protein [Sediminihaliea albiluteola]